VEKIKLYRGAYMSKNDVNDYINGKMKIFSWSSFISTTTSREVAEGFL
jgi:hypothetical protein